MENSCKKELWFHRPVEDYASIKLVGVAQIACIFTCNKLIKLDIDYQCKIL